MGKYSLVITKKTQKHLQKIYKSGRIADIQKVEKFILEIQDTPREGIGQPEQLKYCDGEVWLRRINQKDRFVYEIIEENIEIFLVQSLGHYEDT